MTNQAELITTYSKFIDSTYPTGFTMRDNVPNCVIGLVGELLEWQETQAGSLEELLEAGDTVYYITKLITSLEGDLGILNRSGYLGASDIPQAIPKLMDITKKFLYFDPPKYPTTDSYLTVLYPILRHILAALTEEDFTIEQIIIANIDKLSIRWNIPNPLNSEIL